MSASEHYNRVNELLKEIFTDKKEDSGQPGPHYVPNSVVVVPPSPKPSQGEKY